MGVGEEAQQAKLRNSAKSHLLRIQALKPMTGRGVVNVPGSYKCNPDVDIR